MTAMTASVPGNRFTLRGLRDASPLLWWTSLAFLAAFAMCAVLNLTDPRLFNGIGVWVKPAKFYLSLAVHMLTLSFGIMLLPRHARESWTTSLAAGTMVAMALYEMAYITFRAARGEASHFNTSSELAGLLYTLMGAGAGLMMVVTFFIGLRILRQAPPSLMASATGWGFLIAAILTLVIGFTLGGMGSHWIGGDRTDATGLPLAGCSTTGGDLRPAHFLGLHVMQAMPLAALSGSRSLVAGTAALLLLAAIAAYALALSGIPLISF